MKKTKTVEYGFWYTLNGHVGYFKHYSLEVCRFFQQALRKAKHSAQAIYSTTTYRVGALTKRVRGS